MDLALNYKNLMEMCIINIKDPYFLSDIGVNDLRLILLNIFPYFISIKHALKNILSCHHKMIIRIFNFQENHQK